MTTDSRISRKEGLAWSACHPEQALGRARRPKPKTKIVKVGRYYTASSLLNYAVGGVVPRSMLRKTKRKAKKDFAYPIILDYMPRQGINRLRRVK